MIAGVAFLAVGALLTWTSWRAGVFLNQEAISVMEAAILKTAGEEPLPLTKYDRIATRFHAIFGFVFGPVFALLGLALIANAAGLL